MKISRLGTMQFMENKLMLFKGKDEGTEPFKMVVVLSSLNNPDSIVGIKEMYKHSLVITCDSPGYILIHI